MNDKQKRDFDSVESRRSSASQRRMSIPRRLYYALGLPILRGLIRLLTASYRYEPIIGEENLLAFIESGRICAPCYWHQHSVLCSSQVRLWIRQGFKAAFLISGSVDGEVPARVAKAWGAEIVRGSANQSGTLALRDMQSMMKRGYSVVTTADGPRGPKYEFKLGTMLMARISAVPIVPIAAAADRAWHLDRWDDFMIPKPFARVAIAVGEAFPVPRELPLDALEPRRADVQRAMLSLMADCENALHRD